MVKIGKFYKGLLTAYFMKEHIMNVERMKSVLSKDLYLLGPEDHNLVMHDLYTTSVENQEEGKKKLEGLVETYVSNLKDYHGYKKDKEAYAEVKKRLSEASKSIDGNIGGSRVEEYFSNTVKKLKMETGIEEEVQSLHNGLRYDKIINQTDEDFCTILNNFESNKNFSGPMTLLHALAVFYRDKKFSYVDSFLEAYDHLDASSKEVDGTLGSKEIGPVQKHFKYHSTLVN